MVTKIEYAFNPFLLSTSANSSGFTLQSSTSVDDCKCSDQTREVKQKNQSIKACLYNFQGSMDRPLQKHNLEAIRKTMQMHEDIFKHQVRELHRLYSVQKMLMDEMKKDVVKKKRSLHTPSSSQFYTTSAQPTNNFGYNFRIQSVREDPSTREWCNSQSREKENSRMIIRGFDLERPAEEDSTAIRDQGCSSTLVNPKSCKLMSMDGSDDDETEVELTLSIGRSSNRKKKSKSQEMNFCEATTTTATTSSSSSTFDQERKRPDWLFQGLSINRT